MGYQEDAVNRLLSTRK